MNVFLKKEIPLSKRVSRETFHRLVPGNAAAHRSDRQPHPRAQAPQRAVLQRDIPAMRAHELLILFAEDDRSIRETTSDLLAMSGFRVEAVRTGREASRLLARRPVDLLITDLVMPDGDGLWLLEHLDQALPETQPRRFPVVLLTAHADKIGRAHV